MNVRIADIVYAKLRNGEADFEVQVMAWELEETLAFLQDLPEDADTLACGPGTLG